MKFLIVSVMIFSSVIVSYSLRSHADERVPSNKIIEFEVAPQTKFSAARHIFTLESGRVFRLDCVNDQLLSGIPGGLGQLYFLPESISSLMFGYEDYFVDESKSKENCIEDILKVEKDLEEGKALCVDLDKADEEYTIKECEDVTKE